MVIKVIAFCLLLTTVSAVPVHNGYSYEQGISGGLGSASAFNGVKYTQSPSNIVHTTSVQQHHQPTLSSSTSGAYYGNGLVSSSHPASSYGQSTNGYGSYGHGSVSSVKTVSSYGQGNSGFAPYGQGSVSSLNGLSGYGQESYSRGSYAQPSIQHSSITSASGHGGAIFHGFPDAPPAASVGVEYVKHEENNYVEHNAAGFSAPIITKSFYLVSGPEDHDEKTAVHHLNIGKPQKHYRVIFIKNPSSSVNKALIKAHVAPTEEKTVVYVLSKHQNELSVESEVDEPAPTEPSKPDIVFVKYKKPEEIAHLQQIVQEQYNAIPGENHVSDEGFAPVRSIISESESHSHGGHSHGGHSIGVISGSSSDVSNIYSVGSGNSLSKSSKTYTSGPITSGSYGSESKIVESSKIVTTGHKLGPVVTVGTTKVGSLGVSSPQNIYLPTQTNTRVGRDTSADESSKVNTETVKDEGKSIKDGEKAVTDEEMAATVEEKAVTDEEMAATVEVKAVTFDEKSVTDEGKAVADEEKSVTDEGKAVADEEKSVIDEGKAVTGDEKVIKDDEDLVKKE